jgi:hypothetical protein
MTEALAWLIEQPSESYETSSTTVDVLEADPQRHLVAADRVDVVHLGIEGIPQALVVRVAVVIQDDVLVHRFELHHVTS